MKKLVFVIFLSWIPHTTICNEYASVWTEIETPFFTLDASLTMEAGFKPLFLESVMEDVDFGGCGETKGCFLYPRQCSGTDCTAAVTYRYRPTTKDYMFELYTNTADVYDYIALAFSEDKSMGDNDETFSCVSNAGLTSIQQGFNPGHYNQRVHKEDFSNAELKQEDNRLQCRFAVPVVTTVYRIDTNDDSATINSDADVRTYPINLNSSWYLQLAWGKAMEETVVMQKHTEMPVVSDSKVYVYAKTVVVRGSSYDSLVYAHATVMMIAWILLAGIVTVTSRHYKDWMPQTMCYGVMLWFQIHRTLALCIVVLTALGLTFIFANYGSGIRESATPHAYVGLALTAALGVQVTMGMLRPGLNHRYRPTFNWAHWFLGQSTHILAAVTMYLAFDIDELTRDSKDFGFVVLSIWVVIQVVWHLGFEILRWKLTKEENPEAQSIMLGGDKKPLEPTERTCKKTDKLYSILLTIYVITLAGICLACILAFVLY